MYLNMLLESRFQDKQDVKDSGKDKYEFDRIADGEGRCGEQCLRS